MNYKSSNKYNDAQRNINKNNNYVPLTKRMRPNNLNDYVGQSHVIGPKTVLYNLLKTGVIPSMIVWGPPGCGKDALVNLIIEENKTLCDGLITLIELSASTASINDIKKAVKEAKTTSNQTIIIMNEIHKFNKLQQDIFLPHVEAGTFILIGITIENPFSLNSALLSRCRIFMLNKLQKDDLISILSKAVKSINGEIILKSKNATESNVTTSFFIDQEVIVWLAEMCDGDCKIALNGLESAVEAKVSNIDKSTKPINLNISDIKCSLTAIQATNNKQSDNIYQMHSALHHCIIGDDENAALYWLARIMETGEDPVYIAKRLVRVASEDIDFDDEDASLQ
ncbi:PREDICTED: ATPase WRNIP1-like isoform X2 [Ceratosolen solmsi marchali]|uniref:ATPase WRNIP1-like isoform X2 n=1 Tax=Ceratosolen solmsi marchali TaxID=326594 RepID=A0AAJ6YBH8_9HYME|nr:PREDICTED: ATPase WRNIP1-like isoform X2 [Ceratosolen solmsi marchali]